MKWELPGISKEKNHLLAVTTLRPQNSVSWHQDQLSQLWVLWSSKPTLFKLPSLSKQEHIPNRDTSYSYDRIPSWIMSQTLSLTKYMVVRHVNTCHKDKSCTREAFDIVKGICRRCHGWQIHSSNLPWHCKASLMYRNALPYFCRIIAASDRT